MIRLVTKVLPNSYWREGYKLLYLLSVLAICLVMALPWWAIVSMLVIAIIVGVYTTKLCIATQPIHLTAANAVDYNSHWQLLFTGRQRDDPRGDPRNELWEAELVTAKRIGHCVYLVFAVVHPEYKQKVVVLWQDQVTADIWRQFNILAKWA